ncbi:MAG TPA: flagellar hook-associated protein FlgK [Rhodospirillaceae bacterium]|nr:flagellar hook-associated protein FlgK [Rhodospirillaceae bacterium]
MSLTLAIQSAVSGLQSTQRALQTTSDNIANVNTEGYSRKDVTFSSITIDGVGNGVEIGRITRSVDEFLLRQIRDTQAITNNFEIRDKFLQEIQALFGTPSDDNSIATGLADLKNAFEAVALTPENQAFQFEVVGEARELALRMSELATNVQRLRTEAESEIARLVSLIDAGIENVSDLNVQVARNEILGTDPSSIRDARDRELEALAELIDIQTIENSDGRVDIFTKGGRTLLTGSIAIDIAHTAAGALNATTQYLNPTDPGYPGGITGIFLSGSTAAADDITPEIGGGQLQALIDLRDELLPNLQSELDQLSKTILNEVNSQHNTGTAFPPPNSFTGSQSFRTTDVFTATGAVRISVINRTTGDVVENLDIADLSLITSAGAVVTTLDGMANASASLDSNGNLVLSADAAANGIAINVSSSSVTTVGANTRNFGHYFGINDLFQSVTDNSDYNSFVSGQQANSTTALGIAGTLTFNIDSTPTTTAVAYAAGDDLDTIAANITADATLTAANISASVVNDGTGRRLVITDSDNQNFIVTDSGTLFSSINMDIDDRRYSNVFTVRSAVADDPTLVSRGTLSLTAGVGADGIVSGDGTAANNIAGRFDAQIAFHSIGGLSGTNTTISGYAAQILSFQASIAAEAQNQFEFNDAFLDSLKFRSDADKGVNLDEELSELVILEQAFNAAARVVSVVDTMFDELFNAVR